MKTIKILGTGCPKCKHTEAVIRNVVEELKVDAHIEKVEAIQDIIAYNVLTTPAVVIDEEVKLKGRVPTRSEIRQLLV